VVKENKMTESQKPMRQSHNEINLIAKSLKPAKAGSTTIIIDFKKTFLTKQASLPV
jgi:hypothetical protein